VRKIIIAGQAATADKDFEESKDEKVMKNDRKKILIALDYNPTAQKVAEVGYTMAKAMHADVILLHVISDPVYYSSVEYSPIMGFGGYNMELGASQLDHDSLKKASLHFLDKSKHHLGDNTIKTIVHEGEFADSIITAAKDLQVDIIVLGTHSRKWLEDVLMGSVTEKVLHQSTIPLFIVPTKQKKI
jgi:nucleotide-binding universal stress UspA family protein